ncbi:MAG: NADH-quinone oxidoreductase subunit NuoG [Alphaproteobacteria bacterium]|nr:NADH-quinone oxidoreductase subunit NuoG [Alphaproteobacteria bacterium]
MPKLMINDQEVEVENGTSILQAAEQIGVEIPRFCYHDRLSVPANCRMCLVEVEGGPPKPVASCAMACGEGMVVKTESEMVKKARKGVMEMLLINHPLDCPICDQGGECDLQDQAVAYGYDRSRYHENKRAVKDKPLGPLIKTIMTRCINCTRCVRFGEEIAGMTELGQLNRGEDAEIGTFIEKAVTTELSGNMIDICPVGALTSKPYAFKARSWELKKTETVDVHDAVGCNIRVDSRGGEVMRVLPRLHEDINEEWINDRSRFAYDGLKKNRLDRSFVRDTETKKLRACSWEEALEVAADKLSTFKSDNIAAYVGDLVECESVYALKKLMESLKVKQLECRTDGAHFDVTNPSGYRFNSTIAGIEEADAILIVGANPRIEATLVNARIRKTWLERRIPISLIGEEVDLTYPYLHAGTSLADLEKMAKEFAGKVQAKRPMMIVGMDVFKGDDALSAHAFLHDVAEKLGVIKPEENWNGFNILHTAAGRMGALELGFTPRQSFDLSDMGLVYLHGVDNVETVNSINPHAFVIYQGHHGDLGAHRADLILPGAAYTEKDGTYVNMEGRPQRARRVVFAPGEAKEDWTIIRAISDRCNKSIQFNDLVELRTLMVSEHPALGAYDEITPVEWGRFGGAAPKASSAPLGCSVENFYLTNSITRASDTMHKCVEAFIAQETNEDMEQEEAA